MHCPRCQQEIAESVASCPHCGFCDAIAYARFGTAPRYGALVTDTTYAELTQMESLRIKRHLAHFEKKFSQARFSVFMTSLLPGWNINEYAFYLLNRCNFQAPTLRGSESRVVLMTIDLASQNANLSVSYGLEDYLSSDDMMSALQKAAPHLRHRRYVSAVAQAMRETAKRLAASLKS